MDWDGVGQTCTIWDGLGTCRVHWDDLGGLARFRADWGDLEGLALFGVDWDDLVQSGIDRDDLGQIKRTDPAGFERLRDYPNRLGGTAQA